MLRGGLAGKILRSFAPRQPAACPELAEGAAVPPPCPRKSQRLTQRWPLIPAQVRPKPFTFPCDPLWERASAERFHASAPGPAEVRGLASRWLAVRSPWVSSRVWAPGRAAARGLASQWPLVRSRAASARDATHSSEHFPLAHSLPAVGLRDESSLPASCSLFEIRLRASLEKVSPRGSRSDAMHWPAARSHGPVFRDWHDSRSRPWERSSLPDDPSDDSPLDDSPFSRYQRGLCDFQQADSPPRDSLLGRKRALLSVTLLERDMCLPQPWRLPRRVR
jgi:hypothetical protein